ncbi:Oligopeptide transporter, OPT superfamily [Dillenia turbinata]|uniref:Oligopeptide transporter, OPT superfamily n=1 Tax=Dillenia turbinata TaxID=194707 RepID=A0AAN8ZJV6_9MAGN
MGSAGLVWELSLDWVTIASFLVSPLISPFFAIVNIFVGYLLVMYIIIPTAAYWGLNVYNAKTFPIFFSRFFAAQDLIQYEKEGRMNLSMFFSITYRVGFATIAFTLTHVPLFHGRESTTITKPLLREKEDIDSKKIKYKLGHLSVCLLLCIFLKKEIQISWWGLIFAAAFAFIFTLPIIIITAAANQSRLIPGTMLTKMVTWLQTIDNIILSLSI